MSYSNNNSNAYREQNALVLKSTTMFSSKYILFVIISITLVAVIKTYGNYIYS